jgi:hypothetical protein
MTTHKPVSFLAKIVNISSLTAIVLGASSCHREPTMQPSADFGIGAGTSPATQEFINTHGFKPSDYYGAKGDNDYVPGKVPKRY